MEKKIEEVNRICDEGIGCDQHLASLEVPLEYEDGPHAKRYRQIKELMSQKDVEPAGELRELPIKRVEPPDSEDCPTCCDCGEEFNGNRYYSDITFAFLCAPCAFNHLCHHAAERAADALGEGWVSGTVIEPVDGSHWIEAPSDWPDGTKVKMRPIPPKEEALEDKK